MGNIFSSGIVTLADGQPYELLLPIALILISAKLFAILAHHFHIPEVIGFLLSGLLVGLIYFIPNQTILTDYTRNGISILAELGVVLIMFMAGIETDMKKVKAVGKASVLITVGGVIFPLAFGFIGAYLFRNYAGMEPDFLATGIDPVYSDLFYGVILTATSVSITVPVLKELGLLEGKVGNALIAAAIIDDLIGIILLSFIISISGTSSTEFNLLTWIIESCGGHVEGAWNVLIIIVNMGIFFALSLGAFFLVRPLFDFLDRRYPHHIRIPILALAFCFLWAYLAQSFFQIADITGAYIAGLLLSLTRPKRYIDHRTETTANVLFVPIFFASVALKMYDASFDFTDVTFILFGLTFVVLGILGKVVGAGSGALLARFKFKDSLLAGIGMMARAEVLIVTAQRGVDAGLVDPSIIPFCLLLILVTSFATPLLLKLLVGKPKDPGLPGGAERSLSDSAS